MPLRHHLFDLILEEKKHGLYVHSENAVKTFLGLLCEQPVLTGDPGIVKCVVEPSEGFESEWYDPLHLLGLAEVCLDESRRSDVAFDVIDEQSALALTTTCALSSATRLAAAAPMPLFPPVMSATLPANSKLFPILMP